MVYTCKICGKQLKTKRGLNSPQHKNSKRHQRALKRRKTQEKLRNALEREKVRYKMILYIALTQIDEPNFSKIINFATSFGIKTADMINIVLRKIKEGDLQYHISEHPKLKRIYEIILDNLSEFKEYPTTLNAREAFNIFKDLDFQGVYEMVEFFKDLHNKYPTMLSLSSSEIDGPPDLITFKRIFPESILFTPSGRWDL